MASRSGTVGGEKHRGNLLVCPKKTTTGPHDSVMMCLRPGCRRKPSVSMSRHPAASFLINSRWTRTVWDVKGSKKDLLSNLCRLLFHVMRRLLKWLACRVACTIGAIVHKTFQPIRRMFGGYSLGVRRTFVRHSPGIRPEANRRDTLSPNTTSSGHGTRTQSASARRPVEAVFSICVASICVRDLNGRGDFRSADWDRLPTPRPSPARLHPEPA